MVKRVWLLVYVCWGGGLLGQVPAYEWTASRLPFKKAISQLETQYNLLFSYQEEDVKGIQFSTKVDADELPDFLAQIFRPLGLEAELISGNYVLIRKAPSGTHGDTTARIALLSGKVLNDQSGEPLGYASIFLQSTRRGVYCDAKGEFRLTAKLGSQDTLVVQFLGFKTQKIALAQLRKKYIVFRLQTQSLLEVSVDITDYVSDGISLGGEGAATVIQADRVRALPGQVEPDILQTVRFLPGVATPNAQLSQLYIRGGTPDQNLMLWEDIPVYHSAHFFGMVSAINPYIVDQAQVYRGGFGAEQGGRIAGLIDLRSADHQLASSTFGAGANFMQAQTYGKLKFAQQKASLIFSARRSLTDFWASPTYNQYRANIQQGILLGEANVFDLGPEIINRNHAQFGDAHLKLSAKLTPKDEVNIAAFVGGDTYAQAVVDTLRDRVQTDTLGQQNLGLKAAWVHRWKPGQETKLTFVRSQFETDYQFAVQGGTSPDLRSGFKTNALLDQSLRLNQDLVLPKAWNLKVGYQWQVADVAYTVRQSSQQSNLANQESDTASHFHIGYLTLRSPDSKKWGASFGLRYTYFAMDGLHRWEPRLQAWYTPNSHWRLHLHTGVYQQFLSQLIEFAGDQSGIETPIWVLARVPDVPVLSNFQLQLGTIFSQNGWVVDLQAYVKRINGLTSLSVGLEAPTRRPFTLGNSSARGIDVLIKKRWKHFRTWVSYSMTKVDYQYQDFIDPEFAAPYDQRHVLRWANQWNKGPIEVAVGYMFATGKPFTNVFDIFPSQDREGRTLWLPAFEMDLYNGYRLPIQHRLDASFLLNIGMGNDWRGQLGISVVNAFNRENIIERGYILIPNLNQPMGRPRKVDTEQLDLRLTPNAVFRVYW